MIEKFQKERRLRAMDDELLWDMPPPTEGSPGTGVVAVPPHEGVGAAGPGSKPPGTFARGAETPGAPPIATPAEPTAIDMRFVPPEAPVVGTAAHGVVEVSARESIPEVVVTAAGDQGLAVDKPGGVLYRGPLRAGEMVRVPVPMTASQAGSHEMQIDVQSDAPGGTTQLKVFLPTFKSGPAPRPTASPGDKPVSLVFKNVPIRQALMDIAKQAKLRIEIPEGLGTERVSRDVRSVPAKAALRAVAEAGGYSVTEADGVFRIARGSADNPSE